MRFEGHKLEALQRRLKTEGLLIRAWLPATQEDGLPLLPNGQSCRSLVLVGNAGSDLWPAFSRSPEYRDGQPDPLDRWSRRLGEALAREFDGLALFPFDGPPYYPFLSWARRSDRSMQSPLGMSLHPQYGLWHAYRFALAFEDRPVAEAEEPVRSQWDCDHCVARPCLTACPVDAFDQNGYRVQDCARFLARNPDYDCNHLGCAARRACPVGQNYRYLPEHAQFHMKIFVELHGDAEASETQSARADSSAGGSRQSGI